MCRARYGLCIYKVHRADDMEVASMAEHDELLQRDSSAVGLCLLPTFVLSFTRASSILVQPPRRTGRCADAHSRRFSSRWLLLSQLVSLLARRLSLKLQSLDHSSTPGSEVRRTSILAGLDLEKLINEASLNGIVIVAKIEVAVAQWVGRSPPTTAISVRYSASSLPDFRMWESCWSMPLATVFSRGTPVSPSCIPAPLHPRVSFHVMPGDDGSRTERPSLGECCLPLGSLHTLKMSEHHVSHWLIAVGGGSDPFSSYVFRAQQHGASAAQRLFALQVHLNARQQTHIFHQGKRTSKQKNANSETVVSFVDQRHHSTRLPREKVRERPPCREWIPVRIDGRRAIIHNLTRAETIWSGIEIVIPEEAISDFVDSCQPLPVASCQSRAVLPRVISSFLAPYATPSLAALATSHTCESWSLQSGITLWRAQFDHLPTLTPQYPFDAGFTIPYRASTIPKITLCLAARAVSLARQSLSFYLFLSHSSLYRCSQLQTPLPLATLSPHSTLSWLVTSLFSPHLSLNVEQFSKLSNCPLGGVSSELGIKLPEGGGGGSLTPDWSNVWSPGLTGRALCLSGAARVPSQ
ncbi:hypothetical protein PR048_000439 [Dryococelus australis]|uniref:Uncharacterized protein n=1 Tax=Dryococelus australis TaxID=614101 RepID=A0ABQ9IEL5_9NEOP|nr:hypothetical protein PR048_000439 [Dryococelus australis]